jgi:hypothetical protein
MLPHQGRQQHDVRVAKAAIPAAAAAAGAGVLACGQIRGSSSMMSM